MNYLERKKKAIMSMINQIKGLIKNITGVPPITLDDCVDNDSIINYQIYGNSVQDGTPTPDTPIEVKSVGDYDEESGKYKIPITATNESGKSVTTYIYLDEPLRAIGDYKDYIDFENKVVVRHIYSEFLKTVNTVSSTTSLYKKFLTNISKKPLIIKTGTIIDTSTGFAISNKFKYSGYTYANIGNYPNCIQPYITAANKNNVVYTFDDTSITTVKQAQEIIGDGFEVCYVLDEPIEEIIDLPKLPTFRGNTIYTIGTMVRPIEMSVKYYSTNEGTTRIVEGDNQVILTDCVDNNSLKSIKLYGKTVDIPTDYYVYRTRNDEVIPSGTVCYFTIEGVNYSFNTSEEVPILTLFKHCISTGETIMVKDGLETTITTEIVSDVIGMTNIPMSNEKNPDNPYELKSITNPTITIRGGNSVQTVTLPDITLNGFISYSATDIVTPTDVGYFDDIGTQYWADSIILKDNKVYLRTNVRCGTVGGLQYLSDIKASNANAQHYMVSGKWGTTTITHISINGKNYAISGGMSSHFKTLFSKSITQYSQVPITYNDFGFTTGSVPGAYVGNVFYIIPKNALGEDETFSTYLTGLVSSGNLKGVVAISTLETDITDTEAGQALLNLRTYKGNTIIETDGHLSVEYLSNTEE